MSVSAETLYSPGGNLRRRRRVNRIVEIASTVATILAVAVLVIVVGSVALKGLSAINLDFLTKTGATTSFSATGAGTGIANAIVGTGILVLIASVIAIPIGLLVAIFTHEFAPPRVGHVVSFVLDVLNGVPTIITGIFIYGLLVVGGTQSGWAGGIALAIVMLPIFARTAQEVLSLVPTQLRESAYSLGVTRCSTLDHRAPCSSMVARSARSSTSTRAKPRSGRPSAYLSVARASTPAVPQHRPLLSQNPGRSRAGRPECVTVCQHRSPSASQVGSPVTDANNRNTCASPAGPWHQP